MCDALSDGSFNIAVPRHLIATILAEADGEGLLLCFRSWAATRRMPARWKRLGFAARSKILTVGPWPACIRLASLPGEASLCQSRRFSMRERPRRKASNRAASALSGARLVMP